MRCLPAYIMLWLCSKARCMQCPCQLCNTNQVASVQRDFKSGEGKDAEASWFGYHGDISALRVACLSQHKKILEVTEEKVLCGTSASICQTLHCVGLDLSKHAHLGPGIASMTLQEQFSSVYFEVAAGAKEAGTCCALLHCWKADAGPQWKMELSVLGAWPVLFTFFRMEACNWEVLAVFLLFSRERFPKQLPW